MQLPFQSRHHPSPRSKKRHRLVIYLRSELSPLLKVDYTPWAQRCVLCVLPRGTSQPWATRGRKWKSELRKKKTISKDDDSQGKYCLKNWINFATSNGMAGPIPPAAAAAIGGGKLKAGSFRKCGGKDFFCKIFCFCWVLFFLSWEEASRQKSGCFVVCFNWTIQWWRVAKIKQSLNNVIILPEMEDSSRPWGAIQEHVLRGYESIQLISLGTFSHEHYLYVFSTIINQQNSLKKINSIIHWFFRWIILRKVKTK